MCSAVCAQENKSRVADRARNLSSDDLKSCASRRKVVQAGWGVREEKLGSRLRCGAPGSVDHVHVTCVHIDPGTPTCDLRSWPRRECPANKHCGLCKIESLGANIDTFSSIPYSTSHVWRRFLVLLREFEIRPCPLHHSRQHHSCTPNLFASA